MCVYFPCNLDLYLFLFYYVVSLTWIIIVYLNIRFIFFLKNGNHLEWNPTFSLLVSVLSHYPMNKNPKRSNFTVGIEPVVSLQPRASDWENLVNQSTVEPFSKIEKFTCSVQVKVKSSYHTIRMLRFTTYDKQRRSSYSRPCFRLYLSFRFPSLPRSRAS